MIRSTLISILLLAPLPAFSDSSTDAIIETGESILASTNPLEELMVQFASDPDFAGKFLTVCANGECAVLDRTDTRDKGGVPEPMNKASWTKDVSDIVKSATGGVSGAGTVKVSVTHTNTKKDGTSTSTTVNVEVSVSGSKK